MIRILANDGIHPDGKRLMEEAGYEVDTNKIPQEELAGRLNAYDGIIVRSATKVRQALIDASPNLKVIARAGVGIDNIDHEYAKSKGIPVFNTPAASSQSVAELTFAHIFSLSRSLYDANRKMPQSGDTAFKKLKKSYAGGMELKGKTIGIVGFGRIGQSVARIAMGLGMQILPVDLYLKEATLTFEAPGGQSTFSVHLPTVAMEEMLPKADFITVHVPGGNVLGAPEIAQMKNGVRLINTSRGGVIDEEALLAGLDSGKIGGAGLDVFVGEPTPSEALLHHPAISLSPHIGASTLEAQRNIGLELAEKIIGQLGRK